MKLESPWEPTVLKTTSFLWRRELLGSRKLLPLNRKIKVVTYDGLTVDFAQQEGVNFLLRGLRNPADFEFEKAIAQANREMTPELETVFLLTSARYAYISSSIVREVFNYGGDFTKFVPSSVKP